MSQSSLPRPLSTEEIETFHRDGAVLLKGILNEDWVEVLREGLEFANNNPTGMSGGVDMPLRIDQFPAAHSPQLKRFLDESPIAEIVGTVLDAPVRFYMDQMFYKPSGFMPPSLWHQDTNYYNVDGDQLIRAWVCVDPAPREISLEVLRGSHLWNVCYRPPVGLDPQEDPESAAALDKAFADGEILIGRDAHEQWTYFDSFLDPSLPPLPRIEEARDSFDIVGWDYAPGDVLLFHGHIVHSARGDVESPTPRRAHGSLWAGPDIHYLRRRSQSIPDPQKLYDHEPKDGQRLSEFPDVFPVAWPPAEAV
ncbi:MAG: phytanoyl-CoA dioxygenase family protein [Halioglobus sp.]